MAREQLIEHLLRRSGFGASDTELGAYMDLGFRRSVDRLIHYEQVDDAVDANIGKPGFVAVTTRGQFLPNANIVDARQRWLFRMVHSARPLQEKMALFWHNHFATAYSKLAGALGATEATRYMAAKASEDPAHVRGQLEMLRENALGNFRDLLVAIAKDTAMLVWLDGRTNVKSRPQENFGRELMELFSMGVGFFTEPDVYAAARVFTGWNLARTGAAEGAPFLTFAYNANQHETTAKEFSFAIYQDGGRTIPARAAGAGMQDGLDLIAAVARHPETARRLARKLYEFFVSETTPPAAAFVDELASVYLEHDTDIRAVLQRLLTSTTFVEPVNHHSRYSWPVEFVVRALKEVGWTGFSVNDALTPLANMGQTLYEPPDVSGWNLGRAWISTGAMLARMNFAAQLASNQKFKISTAAREFGGTPQRLILHFLDRLTPLDFDRIAARDLLDYVRTNAQPWTGSDDQLLVKAPGLVHLIVGSPQYQFV